jgi:hypothetical protein
VRAQELSVEHLPYAGSGFLKHCVFFGSGETLDVSGHSCSDLFGFVSRMEGVFPGKWVQYVCQTRWLKSASHAVSLLSFGSPGEGHRIDA